MTAQLLVFGPGYSAQPVIKQAQLSGWKVFATFRTEEKHQQLLGQNIDPVPFSAEHLPNTDITSPLHIIVSIAPKGENDPTLAIWSSWLRQQNNLATINYLSSTNVYGDRQGGWVNEETIPAPTLQRGKHRLNAETEWRALAEEIDTPLFIFRLAGIYGPGRNAFEALEKGRARCITKDNQVFSRIHVDDIRQSIWAAMNSGDFGGIYNLADDEPTPPHEVIEAAAAMIGITPPSREPWDTAELSEMARSFYTESKRVKNDKIKKELGVKLSYPNYRVGLSALKTRV